MRNTTQTEVVSDCQPAACDTESQTTSLPSDRATCSVSLRTGGPEVANGNVPAGTSVTRADSDVKWLEVISLVDNKFLYHFWVAPGGRIKDHDVRCSPW